MGGKKTADMANLFPQCLSSSERQDRCYLSCNKRKKTRPKPIVLEEELWPPSHVMILSALHSRIGSSANG